MDFRIFKFALDAFLEICLFPFWWYGKGFFKTIKFCFSSIAQYFKNRGIGIGFKFLFKPMYSQNDFWGRFISFFIRLFVLIFKILVFFIVAFIYLSLIIAWILLPIFVLYQICINFNFLFQ